MEAVELGAGEILLTSVDREGTGKGFDLDLVRMISEAVSVPVIAHGGAGSSQDVIPSLPKPGPPPPAAPPSSTTTSSTTGRPQKRRRQRRLPEGVHAGRPFGEGDFQHHTHRPLKHHMAKAGSTVCRVIVPAKPVHNGLQAPLRRS
jgi:hypothetical protein